MKVRRIGASKHKSTHFTEFSFFLKRENDRGQKVDLFVKYKLYLVKDFKANIMIENNISNPEKFIFDVNLGYIFIRSCEIKITMRAK